MTSLTTTTTSPARGRTAAPAERGHPATVVLTSTAFLMVTIDALVVATALPSIHAALGGDAGTLQWIVNAYNLTFAAGIVTGAALGDRFGRRRLFLIGLALFTVASAACALAPTLGLLVAARAVQGLGGAILTPVGLTLISEAFPPARRGAAIGLWGGIAGLGVAAGPLVGGAVTQGLDWHWVFWVNVPVGVVALAGCARVVRESRGPRRALDLPGMFLVGVALAALAGALSDAPVVGWAAARTVALLAVFAAALGAFVLRERYAAAPMVPLALLRVRSFAAANAAYLLNAAAIFSAAYMMSQFFQLGRGNSPLGAGLAFLPWTVTPLVVAPIAGVWCDRVGARRLAVPGLAMQAAGFAAIVALAGTHQPWIAYAGPFVIAGIGVSLALPSLPAAALGAAGRDQVGVAAGVVNTVQRVGSVIGVAVITAVFSAHGSLATPPAVVGGFRWALAASAGLSLLGAAAAAGIARRTAVTGRG